MKVLAKSEFNPLEFQLNTTDLIIRTVTTIFKSMCKQKNGNSPFADPIAKKREAHIFEQLCGFSALGASAAGAEF